MPEAEQVKFVLRLPEKTHKKLKRRASANNTSMNKEITNILNDTFSNATTKPTLTTRVRVD